MLTDTHPGTVEALESCINVVIALQSLVFLTNIFASICPETGAKLIFTRGHISLVVAFKGPNIILGLYKYNYPLTRDKELGAAPWVETRCRAG